MINNGEDAGQWPDGTNGNQRGPSFEDPMQPPPPRPVQPAPEQNWHQAQGMNGQQGPAAQEPSFPPGGAPYFHGSANNGQQPAPQPDQNPYATPLYGQDPYAVAPSPYQQPYGSYGGYGVYGRSPSAKSKTTAAVLAFFLGGLGAHSFYLGKKNLGLTHLVLGIGGLLLMVVAGNAMNTASSSADVLPALMVLLGLAMWLGNILWAFVEFLIIIFKSEYDLGR